MPYAHITASDVQTFFTGCFTGGHASSYNKRHVSQAISHVSFNSNIILKSLQKFHIIFHTDELWSLNLLKSVFASQDISRDVSHPKKIHLAFTWTSHTFHRVDPSSDAKMGTNCSICY